MCRVDLDHVSSSLNDVAIESLFVPAIERFSAEMGGNVVGAANYLAFFHRHVRVPGALIAQH